MKKLILLICVILLTGFQVTNAAGAQDEGPCEYKSFSITVGAGARGFSEKLFEDVYGSTAIIYSFDAAMKVWQTLEVFVHTDYLAKTGELTFTGEESDFKLIPIELGGRYLIPTKKASCDSKLFLYMGAGAGYYLIKEENAIGTVDEKKVGFFGEGGFRFYFTGSIFVDAKLKYTILKSENETDLGGLSYMGGIGFSF